MSIQDPISSTHVGICRMTLSGLLSMPWDRRNFGTVAAWLGSLTCLVTLGCTPFSTGHAAAPGNQAQDPAVPAANSWPSPIVPTAGQPISTPANRSSFSAALPVEAGSSSGRYTARQFPETLPAPQPLPPSALPPTSPSDSFTGPGSVMPAPNGTLTPPGGAPFSPYDGATADVLPPSMIPAPVPTTRQANLYINGMPARTGRIMFGGAVNSDAGVTGQITVDERNFDITRWPTSFRDLFSGTAFRGAGQTLRIEAIPGSRFKRYMVNFADPNLLGYLPVSLSVSGFLFDRRYEDWDEQRLGGRVALGYNITPDLSVSFGVRGQEVEITDPATLGVPQLDEVLGENELYSGEISLAHDTRDSPLLPSRGHYFEFSFEEVFGDFDYARFETQYRTYFLLAQRADGSGKQTLSYSVRLGFSGKETPVFENFFAGGYATLRGFDFRGASPSVAGVEVGGRFQWLNSVEYMFPITADDAFRGVAFVDFGTVERSVTINSDNVRVAPGVGLRVAIPMLGPAPLAFDFAFPVAKASTDDERIFNFYMSSVF